MEFTTLPNLKSRKRADLLVIPFWKTKEHVQAAFDTDPLKKLLSEPLSTHDFHGKEGEIMFLYVSGQPEKRLALIGLGAQTDITVEKLRRAYANITRACHKNKLKDINICLPKCTSMEHSDVVTGISEGLLLPNYAFTALKKHTVQDDAPVMLEKVTLIEGETLRYSIQDHSGQRSRVCVAPANILILHPRCRREFHLPGDPAGQTAVDHEIWHKEPDGSSRPRFRA